MEAPLAEDVRGEVREASAAPYGLTGRISVTPVDMRGEVGSSHDCATELIAARL